MQQQTTTCLDISPQPVSRAAKLDVMDLDCVVPYLIANALKKASNYTCHVIYAYRAALLIPLTSSGRSSTAS